MDVRCIQTYTINETSIVCNGQGYNNYNYLTKLTIIVVTDNCDSLSTMYIENIQQEFTSFSQYIKLTR